MKRLLIPTLIALGAAALARPVNADLTGADESVYVPVNPRAEYELRSAAARLHTATHQPNDTTYLGFNPAYAGSNYWSIGVGHRWPRGAYGPGKGDVVPVPNDDTGYWDWDHPVHGDSLQGWWPVRHTHPPYSTPVLNDKLRPRHAIDIGNQISYVISQGPGHQRTFGVTSAWHVDPGLAPVVRDPSPNASDVNPKPPRWTPLAGSKSAWCGLRAHGDVTEVDPATGNPYNVDALGHSTVMGYTDPGTTRLKYPGYASQWDQLLYKDVDISGASAGASVSVSFRYRTRMSTALVTIPAYRAGWFDKDPLAVVAGNFISSSDAGVNAPIDSFMVYVGRPVVDTLGAAWTGSDGLTHQVYDPVRRWFGELIRANEAGGHYELFTTFGNKPPIATPADSNAVVTQTATRNVTYGALRAAWGNRIRLVFRIKTNRGRETPSSDDTGSQDGTYSSGYLGAAQVDEVSIDLGSGAVPLGSFENESDIDNSPGASSLTHWKTSSKPPAVHFHVHALSDLTYEDICGAPGSPNRICDMAGNVVSVGDHDRGEQATGPSGTAEQDQFEGIVSPTINLAFNPGNPTAKNNMGLDADMAVPTAWFGIKYNIYSGVFLYFATGQAYQVLAQAYPAVQSDGTRAWSEACYSKYVNFSSEKRCYDGFTATDVSPFVRTSNANGVPDSIRIGLVHRSECYRFSLTTNCGGTAGGYFDNVSLWLMDQPTPPIAILPWDFWNDTFPANETAGLPGTAAFDTTAALIKTGLNIAPSTGDETRYDVPGDTTLVQAPGDSVEVQLVFRILPGPGNYKIPGDVCSGLRRVPADTTRVTPADGSFWSQYILSPGKGTGSFPTTGPCKGGGALRHDQRWSELVWCNARCDTAEQNVFPIQSRGIGGPLPGTYASMYHENDAHRPALGLTRHKCFLVDTLLAANTSNITCTAVPAWVTAGGPPYKTGYDGNPSTTEGTKILADGLLTPGSHVQYFYAKKNLATGAVAMCPDTGVVYPQLGEESLDGHRWQQFSVLPDAWKFSAYGGLGKACLLYVDWDDRGGTERAWVSIADTIQATTAFKRGAHNGWSAPGRADINDPAYFVHKNGQPGTTWDMYGVKGAGGYGGQAGTLGSRLAHRVLGTYLTDKWAKNAPTPEMLAAYYHILMILTGDINTYSMIGPLTDQSANDTEIIRQFVTGATAGDHRGLFIEGSGIVEELSFNGNSTLLGLLGVSLRNEWYMKFSGNGRACIDLIPTSVITTNGDIYGIRNSCLTRLDVLSPTGDAQAASYYDAAGADPLNAPYVSGVFYDAETVNHPTRYSQTLVDGWNTEALQGRLCDTSGGRQAYFWSMFTNIFGKICPINGGEAYPLEVPRNGDGKTFVDLAGIGNNPLRCGDAVIHLTLAHADQVTVRIYDVSGRLVRTLADGQLFKAGKVDPALTWDGLDNAGRRVARGAYFVSVRYERSRFEANRKMIVLR